MEEIMQPGDEHNGGASSENGTGQNNEEPHIYAIQKKGSKWGVNRREFVSTAIAGASSLAGCSGDSANKPVTSPSTAIDPVAHTDKITIVAALSNESLLISSSNDKTIKLWNLPSGDLAMTLLGHDAAVTHIAVSANGKHLATADSSGAAKIWSLTEGKERQTIACGSNVAEVFISNDGDSFISRHGSRATLWSVVSGKADRQFILPALKLHRFAEHESSLYSVTVTTKNAIEIASLSNTETKQSIANVPASHISASPDGRFLAVICSDQSLRVYTLAEGRLLGEAQVRANPTKLEFVDNDTIEALSRNAGGGHDATTYRVIDAWQLARSLDAHSGPIFDFAISPSGRSAATAGKDRSIKIWNVDDWNLQRTIAHPSGEVLSAAFTQNEDAILAGTRDGTVSRCSLQFALSPPTLVAGHGHGVTQIRVDGDRAWTCGKDDKVKIWDLQSGGNSQLRDIQTFSGNSPAIHSLAVSSGVVATGSMEGEIRLWTKEGATAGVLTGHEGPVYALTMVNDRQLLASGGRDKGLRLWNISTKKLARILLGHTDAIYSIASNPKNQWLASCGRDKMVRLWDLANYTQLHTLETDATLIDVVFLGNGHVAASGDDGRVRIWSPPNLEEVNSDLIAASEDAANDLFVVVKRHEVVVYAHEKRLAVHSLKGGQRLTTMNDLVATQTETERVEREIETQKALAEAKTRREQKARETTTYSAPTYTRPTYSPPTYTTHYWRPN